MKIRSRVQCQARRRLGLRTTFPVLYLESRTPRMVIYGREEWKRQWLRGENLGAQYNIFYFAKHDKWREVVSPLPRSTRSELTIWRILWNLSVRRQKDKGRAIKAEATRSKMTNLKKMYIYIDSLKMVYLICKAIISPRTRSFLFIFYFWCGLLPTLSVVPKKKPMNDYAFTEKMSIKYLYKIFMKWETFE